MSKYHTDLLVTGGSGLLGSALKKIQPNATYISSKQYDLTSAKQTEKMFLVYRPKQVVHLAAKVGGVKANNDYVADFCTDNMLINTHVLKYAHKYDVEKVVSVLSTCVYPDEKYVTYPLTEEQLHMGPSHNSNFGYAYAKRMLDVQSRACNMQHGTNFLCVIPNNLFGEHDNFDLDNSHVLPAVIRKVWEAKLHNEKVVLWSDGSAVREFSYALDIAKAIQFVLYNVDKINYPLNIGNTNEISIRDLANKIADNFDYKGNIVWDATKPKGQHKKPSSNKKFMEFTKESFQYTSFDKALENTCNWFKSCYPNVRGVE